MAASLVCEGKTVCDVGCDHGKLSLYLVKSGKAENVIATDINKMPLQKAIDLFQKHNLSHKAQFLLTDGLDGIENTQDISHVVIAGLGGETMSCIIENAPFIKQQKTKLVLIPAQSGYRIREYLYKNGFEITQENTVAEKKKFYSAISAVYTGKCVNNPDIYQKYIGKSENCTGESAKGYFEMVLSQLEKKVKGALNDTGDCPKELSDSVEKVKQLIQNA